MKSYRVLVGVHLRKVVPVVLEGLGGDQGTPVGVEVGLEVARKIPLGRMPEGVVGNLIGTR